MVELLFTVYLLINVYMWIQISSLKFKS